MAASERTSGARNRRRELWSRQILKHCECGRGCAAGA
jgi:hypothetical protein